MRKSLLISKMPIFYCHAFGAGKKRKIEDIELTLCTCRKPVINAYHRNQSCDCYLPSSVLATDFNDYAPETLTSHLDKVAFVCSCVCTFIAFYSNIWVLYFYVTGWLTAIMNIGYGSDKTAPTMNSLMHVIYFNSYLSIWDQCLSLTIWWVQHTNTNAKV